MRTHINGLAYHDLGPLDFPHAQQDVILLGPPGTGGEIIGDDMAAVAMVDRLIHHAELISLKGDSRRLGDRDVGPRHTRPIEALWG